jgi:ABC-2 type transport system ATP-binding protein
MMEQQFSPLITEETYRLQVTGLTKRMNDFYFGPVHLQAEPGLITALVGPNGSGKTTLFRMLMNIVNPDSGQMQIGEVSFQQDRDRFKQLIAYAPEELQGCDHLRIKDISELVQYWYPSWSASDYARLSNMFGIPQHKKYGSLSKGSRKKVSFVLALSCRTPVLLLDEPTANLDLASQRQLTQELVQYMENGQHSLVMATHVIEDIHKLADFIVVMRNGQKIGSYEKDAVLNNWKTFWVTKAEWDSVAAASSQIGDQQGVPGVAHVERGAMTKIMSNLEQETRKYLHEHGATIVGEEVPELGDVLEYLMEEAPTNQSE